MRTKVRHYGLILSFPQLSICIPISPKDAFVPFPLSLKPSSEGSSQQECTLGQSVSWSVVVFLPVHASHSSFPCMFRLGSRVCLLLLVLAKMWWLISCFSLWEDSSDITHAFKPTGLVPLSSSSYALCSLTVLCWCMSALDQTFHLQSYARCGSGRRESVWGHW